MSWIKRNLLLAVGGLLALALLGAGVFYFWTNRQKNKQIESQLEENKATLTRLISQNPYPSPTNITRAKQELEQVRGAINQGKLLFQPVPFEPVTGEAFKALLDNTIFELHEKADGAGVLLPSKAYAFTFAHQKTQLQFPPEAFPALPQQLAEIRLLCGLLFDSRVNKMITLRRARVYSDEPVTQVDHHAMSPKVDEAMGVAANPYEIVFHSFSSELASTMESFYRSTNGLVVKMVAVEVAPAPEAVPGAVPPARPPAAAPAQPSTRQPPAPAQRAGAAAPGRPDGIKTVLNEKLLKITLVVDVMRTIPQKI